MGTQPGALPATRLVAGVDGRGRGVTFESPMPELSPGHVAVQVHATMISPGTQLRDAPVLRKSPRPEPPSGLPTILGYQSAGVVAAVGENVTQFRVGQRVACMGGEAQHSNWNVAPQNLCAPMPDAVEFDQASGIALVLTALHAVRRARIEPGEFVLVVGLGLVGQFAARLAQLSGAFVFGSDMQPARRRLIEAGGVEAGDPATADFEQRARAFTQGHGFDAAVMAVGGTGDAAARQVQTLMKHSPDGHAYGRLVMVGGLTTTHQWGAGMGNLDVLSAARTGPGYHDKDWEVSPSDYPPVFVRWTTRRNMLATLRWMAAGRLDLSPVITHRLGLNRMDEAVDLLLAQPTEAVGVVLVPEHS